MEIAGGVVQVFEIAHVVVDVLPIRVTIQNGVENGFRAHGWKLRIEVVKGSDKVLEHFVVDARPNG